MNKSEIEPFDGGDDTPLAPPPSNDPPPTADPPPSGEQPAQDPTPPAPSEPPLAGDDGPIPQPIVQPKPSVWNDGLEKRGFQKDGFSEDDADYLEEAKRNGWTPPENFKGNPNGYVGPKKFVEQGRKSPAAVRRENTQMERQIADMAKAQQQILDQQNADRARAIQVGYQRAMQDIQNRKQDAWNRGDARAMAQADQDLVKLVQGEERRQAQERATTQQPQQVPEFITGWQAENSWYGPNGDAEKTKYADSLVEYYTAQGYTQKALLDVVTKDVEAKFGGAQPNPNDPPKRETLTIPAKGGFQPPAGGAEQPRQNSQQQATISSYDPGVQAAFADFFEEHGPSGTSMYPDKAKAEKAFLEMMKGW